MKIIKCGDVKTIMSNPDSVHNYFAWPTVGRLQNGKIAVVASGFRIKHVCPFGKVVISYSEDEGETYTAPAIIVDTPLDDRDSGILAYGESDVIITTFNNSVNFQRRCNREGDAYINAYLNRITEEQEKAAIGVNFRISHDCGKTFGEIHKCPVGSPHGPAVLKDGSLLWVGRTFNPENDQRIGIDCVKAYKITPDGSVEYTGEIENVVMGDIIPLCCEPHAIALDDGSIVAHFRVNKYENSIFTVFQSKSYDGGKTWTKPRQLLSDCGGAPPHLYQHSSGMLICTYGFRGEGYTGIVKVGDNLGVKAMFSRDGGETWDIDNDIYITQATCDLGYPSTTELSDGSLLTVFYSKTSNNEPAVIMQQKWRFEE